MKKPLKKIMLIDDDAVTNLLNEYLLKSLGVAENIVICTTGEEALDYFLKEDENADLIFLDINMPGLGGFDFIQEFRKAILKNEVPIVLLTSTINNEDFNRAKNLNVSAFLDKPLNEKKLNQFFEKYFAY